MSDNYYELLEVERDAPADEIKRAFKKAALKYHPDRNQGDASAEETFKACAEAYEVLSDPDKRQIYDRFGKEGLEGRGVHTGFSGFDDVFSHFGDIFSDIFGGMGGGPFGFNQRRRKAHDLQMDTHIGFDEAARGLKKDIEISRPVTCSDCKGRGYPADAPPSTCPECRGRGKVLYQQGFFTLSNTCSTCRGAGKVVTKSCDACHGEGRTPSRETVSVDIPAGVATGNKLVLRGKGEEGGEGIDPGDLFVRIFVAEHEFLKREGAELYAEIPVSMVDVALGSEQKLSVLEDTVRIKIPEGTQPDAVFTFRSKGFPRLQETGRGDLHVRVRVVIPKKLNRKQKKLLKEFSEARG